VVHGHSHSPSPPENGDRRALTGALVLIVLFMAGEVVFGLIASSLALLADAGHMLTDAAALGLAIFAATMAARPAQGRWTFGYKRVEVLAAQINGLTLLIIGVWILYGAIRRLIEPADVEGGIMLVVALVGVLVNLGATQLLSGASRTSINVRGAFVHVLNDLAAFAGTAVAGGLILATGWDRFDPASAEGIRPIGDFATILFTLPRYRERLAPDYLLRVAALSPDLPAALVLLHLVVGAAVLVGVHELGVGDDGEHSAVFAFVPEGIQPVDGERLIHVGAVADRGSHSRQMGGGDDGDSGAE